MVAARLTSSRNCSALLTGLRLTAKITSPGSTPARFAAPFEHDESRAEPCTGLVGGDSIWNHLKN